MNRKICIVTGSRAEYGLLRWLMQEIKNDDQLTLQIAVTGMHLSPDFGNTYLEIEADDFVIDSKIEMFLSDDTPAGIVKSMGLGVIGFADALKMLSPDVVIVLGDRFEILAAVQAAMMFSIPIAHISGGEVTEGALDDRIRHAITKMSDFHFVATDTYRQRVVQMGESPKCVMNYGDPGLDNFKKLKLFSKLELEKAIKFSLGATFFLVTLHPLTSVGKNAKIEMEELLLALDEFPETRVIITKPNADSGGKAISALIDSYHRVNSDRVFVSSSLGQLQYLSALKTCSLVIGNSSSGIVEAPAINTPTVNIGNRQTGRLKAKSIIDCEANKEDIVEAIRKALSEDFQKSLETNTSLYGNSNASYRIKRFLAEVKLGESNVKGFFDIEFKLD